MIHIPAGVYKVYKDPKINWNYETEAEPELERRQVELPRGKVIGGSSSINGMVYVRGHAMDYDHWAEAGADGRSFAGEKQAASGSEHWPRKSFLPTLS